MKNVQTVELSHLFLYIRNFTKSLIWKHLVNFDANQELHAHVIRSFRNASRCVFFDHFREGRVEQQKKKMENTRKITTGLLDVSTNMCSVFNCKCFYEETCFCIHREMKNLKSVEIYMRTIEIYFGPENGASMNHDNAQAFKTAETMFYRCHVSVLAQFSLRALPQPDLSLIHL